MIWLIVVHHQGKHAADTKYYLSGTPHQAAMVVKELARVPGVSLVDIERLVAWEASA